MTWSLLCGLNMLGPFGVIKTFLSHVPEKPIPNPNFKHIQPTIYHRRMDSQLIIDKQSKQQHNLFDTRICCISYFTLDI
jgi:hypothetical protein